MVEKYELELDGILLDGVRYYLVDESVLDVYVWDWEEFVFFKVFVFRYVNDFYEYFFVVVFDGIGNDGIYDL